MEPLSQIRNPFAPKCPLSVCREVWDPGLNSVAFDACDLTRSSQEIMSCLGQGWARVQGISLQGLLAPEEVPLYRDWSKWNCSCFIDPLVQSFLSYLICLDSVCVLDPETAFKWEHVRRSLCCFGKRVCGVFAPEFPNTPFVWEKQRLSPAGECFQFWANTHSCCLAVIWEVSSVGTDVTSACQVLA